MASKHERYIPHPLEIGWGIIDIQTGELKRSLDKGRWRIERYAVRIWAANRCKQLNQED